MGATWCPRSCSMQAELFYTTNSTDYNNFQETISSVLGVSVAVGIGTVAGVVVNLVEVASEHARCRPRWVGSNRDLSKG
jgi:hypothetical protein